MRIVILGLSLSSSWGNGHATTWRALIRAMAPQHDILFLERDVPWYAAHRDLPEPGFCDFALYDSLESLDDWREEIARANAVIIGSYVPDGVEIVRYAAGLRTGLLCFYDIDTPVTLAAIDRGDCAYLTSEMIPLFDIYFSFTGGPTLARLEHDYGAKRAVALYCAVDPERYYPVTVPKRWTLGYLGTYSADRQPPLEALLLEPARQRPGMKFVVAGAQFPDDIDWPSNVERIEHVTPEQHRDFYAAQQWTLNITRADMREAGYSPSVRLFEATACGIPVISDIWDGLDTVFRPDEGIVGVSNAAGVLACLGRSAIERAAIGQAGIRRTRAEHTAAHRAATLINAINNRAINDGMHDHHGTAAEARMANIGMKGQRA